MAALWDCATPRGASKQGCALRRMAIAACCSHARARPNCAARAAGSCTRRVAHRAGHLGTSQDAGACIFIYFYDRQWSLWLRHGRAATSAQYPGSGPSRPQCAGSSTAFGLSSLLQRASQVSVSLLAYRAAAGSQSQQRGIRKLWLWNHTLRYRKKGSAANSTSPPKS